MSGTMQAMALVFFVRKICAALFGTYPRFLATRDTAACVETGKDPLGSPLRTMETVACDTLASFAMHFWVGRGPEGFTFGRRQLIQINNSYKQPVKRIFRKNCEIDLSTDCDRPRGTGRLIQLGADNFCAAFCSNRTPRSMNGKPRCNLSRWRSAHSSCTALA
jgi:hypothetical protein